MPPSFIRRISRSSSDLVTEDPNHHQRIMILASSGGRSNPRWSSVIVCARAIGSAIRSKHTTPAERSIIVKALRIISESKVKSIDVALIEDERRTQPHLVISYFNLPDAPGRHLLVAALER